MKKILITFVFLIGALGVGHAQLQEGTWMLGSDLGSGIVSPGSSGLFGFNFGLNDGAGYDLGISPKLGYFVSDNFVLGAIVGLGFSKSAENNGISAKTTVYGIQAFSRYYLSNTEIGLNDDLLKSGHFFLEGNAGIAGRNVKDGPTTNGFVFGFGPGYSYFVTSNVALETSLKYNGLVGGGNTTYQNSLGLNLGIQIFLPTSQIDDVIDN